MNCKKVRRLLPLFISSGLSPSRASSLKSHLEACSECRNEYEMFVLSLDKTKEWLREDERVWDESEWKGMLKKAASSGTQRKPYPLILTPTKRWMYALVSAASLLLVFFGIYSVLFHRATTPQVSQMLEDESSQKIVSMTLVSQETGLKIHWFLKRDFTLEVKR